MTRTGSIPRIVQDAGIVGRGHAKIAERGHVPWLSLIVGMFTCTLCIIKGMENRKGCKQFAAQKNSRVFCSLCPVRVELFFAIVDPISCLHGHTTQGHTGHTQH
jgi:hypothetical protein